MAEPSRSPTTAGPDELGEKQENHVTSASCERTANPLPDGLGKKAHRLEGWFSG